MIPRQLDEIARLHTRTMTSQPQPASRPARARGDLAAIRKHTGWTLVRIGLRIAESASR